MCQDRQTDNGWEAYGSHTLNESPSLCIMHTLQSLRSYFFGGMLNISWDVCRPVRHNSCAVIALTKLHSCVFVWVCVTVACVGRRVWLMCEWAGDFGGRWFKLWQRSPGSRWLSLDPFCNGTLMKCDVPRPRFWIPSGVILLHGWLRWGPEWLIAMPWEICDNKAHTVQHLKSQTLISTDVPTRNKAFLLYIYSPPCMIRPDLLILCAAVLVTISKSLLNSQVHDTQIPKTLDIWIHVASAWLASRI